MITVNIRGVVVAVVDRLGICMVELSIAAE